MSHPPKRAFEASPEQVAAFGRDGAVVLRGLLRPAEVALLREGIEANLAHPSPRAKIASAREDPGWFIEDFCCWQENAAYRRFIFESALGEVGAALMGSAGVRLYHDHMLTKEPGTRARTPWHQDQPYYNISGSQNCSFWIPVDPVSRASTLEFVAGSHRGPWLMPRSFINSCWATLALTAALLHGCAGEVVSRRQPCGSAGRGGAARRAPHRWLGTGAR